MFLMLSCSELPTSFVNCDMLKNNYAGDDLRRVPRLPSKNANFAKDVFGRIKSAGYTGPTARGLRTRSLHVDNPPLPTSFLILTVMLFVFTHGGCDLTV